MGGADRSSGVRPRNSRTDARVSAVYKCENAKRGLERSSLSKSSSLACFRAYHPLTSRRTVLWLSPSVRLIVAMFPPLSNHSAANLAFASASHLNGPLMCLKPMKSRASVRLSTHLTRMRSGSALGSLTSGRRTRSLSLRDSSPRSRSAANRRFPSRTILPSRCTISGSKSKYPADWIDCSSSSTSTCCVRYRTISSSVANRSSSANRGFDRSKFSSSGATKSVASSDVVLVTMGSNASLGRGGTGAKSGRQDAGRGSFFRASPEIVACGSDRPLNQPFGVRPVLRRRLRRQTPRAFPMQDRHRHGLSLELGTTPANGPAHPHAIPGPVQHSPKRDLGPD